LRVDATDGIVVTSERFFRAVVLPILVDRFPRETAVAAFGVLGLGSEAYGLDDAFSRDHRRRLRINGLLPRKSSEYRQGEIEAAPANALPNSFEESPLRRGHPAGAGVAFDTFENLPRRSVGLERLPETDTEWPAAQEEDFHHVINGVVWHDPSGRFTQVRRKMFAYYPERVWKQ
jgi:hypothetical protein